MRKWKRKNEEEAKEYLKNLQCSLEFSIEKINLNNNFEKELQLFQLLRLVSPETNTIHPNRYHQTLVQIGSYICPYPIEVPGFVSELFHKMNFISNPIIKSIYFVAVGQALDNAKEFGVYADDLTDICLHLKQHGITSVAMESTGSYWQYLYVELEKMKLKKD